VRRKGNTLKHRERKNNRSVNQACAFQHIQKFKLAPMTENVNKMSHFGDYFLTIVRKLSINLSFSLVTFLHTNLLNISKLIPHIH
jgi:hypothetical protein